MLILLVYEKNYCFKRYQKIEMKKNSVQGAPSSDVDIKL